MLDSVLVQSFAVPLGKATKTLKLKKGNLERDPCITLPKAIKQRMMGVYRDLPIINDPSKGDIALRVWLIMLKTNRHV